jgi:hypothetical protein
MNRRRFTRQLAAAIGAISLARPRESRRSSHQRLASMAGGVYTAAWT